jgi:hypothetical protein
MDEEILLKNQQVCKDEPGKEGENDGSCLAGFPLLPNKE